MSRSPEWEDLRAELEAMVGAASCFNAYVFDVWDNFWCAARGFSGPFDLEKTREVVRDRLPGLEALTLRVPPPDGPGADGSEAAGTA
jgi:hypothetical protein